MTDNSAGSAAEITNPKSLQNKGKGHLAKMSILTLLAIILVAGLVYGIYIWQHNQTVSADNKLSSTEKNLDGQIKTLNDQITSLKSSNSLLTSELKAATTKPAVVTQADLSVTVNGVARFNLSNGYTANNTGVAINMTLTNPTGSAIAITYSNFELQDSQNNVYQYADSVIPSTLPSGYIPLSVTTIAPGQTVKGTISFDVEDLTLNNFNLLNGSKSYPVAVK